MTLSPVGVDEDIFGSDDVSPLVLFLVGCDVLEIFQTYTGEEESSVVFWFLQFYSRKETKLGIFSPSIHWWIVSVLIIFYFSINKRREASSRPPRLGVRGEQQQPHSHHAGSGVLPFITVTCRLGLLLHCSNNYCSDCCESK